MGVNLSIKRAVNVIDSVNDFLVDEIDRLLDSNDFFLQNGKLLQVTLVGTEVKRIPSVRFAVLIVVVDVLRQLVLLVLAGVHQSADDGRSAIVEKEV